MLSGRNVSGDEAGSLGLVDRVVESGRASSTAIEMARTYAVGPRQALTDIQRRVEAARDLPLADGLAFEGQAVRELFDSPDGKEGVAAFIEQRPAEFG